MSNYIKTTNFAAKDSLPSGNPAKIVKGTEINTEFDNIAVASATKLNSSAVSTFGGTLIDDANASAARTTLGLGTAATTASTDYATAAQGITADAALPRTGGAMTGAITTNSTFDGRDVATDGTKLDGIEAGATADQTAAEIKTAYESNANTNAFTDTDETKLDGIEAGADVTDTTNVVASLSAGTGISLSAGGEIANTAPDQTVALTGAGGTSISGTYPSFTITSTSFALPVATDTTLGGIELFSDTDQTVVANAVTTTAARTYGIQLNSDDQAVVNVPWTDTTYTVGDGGLTEINFTSADNTKLDGIEASADVTDTANVTAAGALMTTGGTLTGDLDVTGTATMDGLVVDGDSSGTLNNVNFLNTNNGATTTATRIGLGITNSVGAAYTFIEANESGVDSYPHLNFYTGSTATKRLEISNNGDISFYEDTGTTPKFHWDASTESLGIGTSSPAKTLTVEGTGLRVQSTASADFYSTGQDALIVNNGTANLRLWNNGSERMRIDSSGNVGIGTSSPSAPVTIKSNSTSGSTSGLLLQGNSNTNTIVAIGEKSTDGGRFHMYDGGVEKIAFYTDGTANHISSGNVGIGTSSPQRNLHIHGSGNGALKISNSTLGSGNLDGVDLTLNTSGEFYLTNRESGSTIFETGGTERMRIDSSGNVGIGGAPANVTHGPHLDLVGNRGTLTVGTGYFEDNGNTNFIGGARSLAFGAGGSGERMRIDASGNLLVGKSVADVGTAGTVLRGSTSSIFTVSGSVDTQVAIFNKTSVDGAILDFRKDGTTVGSVGVDNSDNLVIEGNSTHSGLQFGTSAVLPHKGGTNIDATVDIGHSDSRFKDLYLSGTANVGSIAVTGAITEDAVTLSGTATTIDLATATNFVHDLTGNTTYTFSNPATTGNASAFTLKIIQGSTARTITWPASVDWAGGTAPTLTTTNNGVDVFVFYTIDGGTTYYGFTAGQAMA